MLAQACLLPIQRLGRIGSVVGSSSQGFDWRERQTVSSIQQTYDRL